MLKTIGWCAKAGVSAVVSLALLSLFTLVYSHTGVHIMNKTGATDYKWEPNQYRATMSEGYSWMRMNTDGFNNSFAMSDTDHIDILLMGSSHMEAVNVSSAANVGYLLNNEVMPELVTYNIGISGHTIYQCVNNMSDAVEFYDPSSYVVIETDRVSLDEGKMEEVIDGNLPIIASHDSGLIYKIQKYVPCFLPLYRELGNWMVAGENATQTEPQEAEGMNQNLSQNYAVLLNRFFEQIVDAVGGRKVIIVYHPETALDDDGVLIPENTEYVGVFQEACVGHGIKFIDMYEDFYREYEENHNMAHGFINTEVGVGHLNEIGHKLVAERLGALIKELENGTE
jgi:hypothetical protein